MLHPWKIPDLDGALSSLIQVEDVPAHYTGLDSVTCKISSNPNQFVILGRPQGWRRQETPGVLWRVGRVCDKPWKWQVTNILELAHTCDTPVTAHQKTHPELHKRHPQLESNAIICVCAPVFDKYAQNALQLSPFRYCHSRM